MALAHPEQARPSQSVWGEPGSLQPPARSFSDRIEDFAVSTFEAFFEYRPSAVTAFVASFLCFCFAVSLATASYVKFGYFELIDMPVYFCAMSGLFCLMGLDIRKRG